MNILEMVRQGEISIMSIIWPVQLLSLAVLCFLLAKSKNRNWKIAIIAGLVPIFNFLAVLYYIGIPKLEKE